MELLAGYAFRYNNVTCCERSYNIGNFNNSLWSLRFVNEKGYSLKITRSNTSQNFAIACAFSIVFKSGPPHTFCSLKDIVDGEANVRFPFSLSRLPLDIYGSITILKHSSSSSKETQVSIDSSTNCIPPLFENSTPSPKLSDDFLCLLNNPDSFADATFKCGAEEILVHKNILSVRSPVFAAMFTNEMQESSSGIVEIVEIEPSVLQATLKYVYSGKTDLLNDGFAGDVLYVASKYELDDLKKVCIDQLKSSMTVDNVFRIMVLGDLHDEFLKTQAKEFVCKCDKFSNLQKTEGWKLLQSEYPGLAMEVLLYVVNFAENGSNEKNASE